MRPIFCTHCGDFRDSAQRERCEHLNCPTKAQSAPVIPTDTHGPIAMPDLSDVALGNLFANDNGCPNDDNAADLVSGGGSSSGAGASSSYDSGSSSSSDSGSSDSGGSSGGAD